MKNGWKLLIAFYMPLHFAFGCFYVVSWILGRKDDCRNSCTFTFNCADFNTLIWVDVFAYSGIGLILLSIVLLIIIESRNKELHPLKLFS